MEKRRKQSVILVIVVIAIIIIVLIAGKIISKYTPSKEKMDLSEYFGVTDASAAAVIVDHKISDTQAVIKDGMAYLDYETVKEMFNARFYWDSNENLLLYTTPDDLVSAAASSKDYFVTKQKNTENYVIVYADAKTAYIAMEYIKKIYGFGVSFL